MKKIEDCLHLYLGCEVMASYKNPFDFKGKLTGKNNAGQWSVQHSQFVIHAYNSENIKPILRPLSCMTEEEIEHVVWLVMDSEKHLEPDCRVGKEDIDIGSIRRLKDAWDAPVNCRCFDGKMLIDTHDGSTTLYDDNDEIQRNFNASLVIAYLLSKGFDLFGLIDAGLAIDKTKTG